MFRSIIAATEKFPGGGAFDHLEWTCNGAFEQLFDLGRRNLNKNFPKIQMPGGLPPGGGMFKLWFDWYISRERKHHRPWRVRKGLYLQKKKQDVNRLERRIFCFWRSQYSLLSARVPWCRGPNWFNSLRSRSKLNNGKLVSFYRQIHKFSWRLFATLIVSIFSSQKLSFWRN